MIGKKGKRGTEKGKGSILKEWGRKEYLGEREEGRGKRVRRSSTSLTNKTSGHTPPTRTAAC